GPAETAVDAAEEARRAGLYKPLSDVFDSDVYIIDREPKTLHKVAKVINANIILLENGDKVRMMGVELTEEDGEKAYRYVRGLLEGKEVRLEFGLRNRDIQGNVLARVYKGDIDINELLEGKFAQNTEIDPAFSYSPEFLNKVFPNRSKPMDFWEMTLGDKKAPKKQALIRLKAKNSPLIKGELVSESKDFLLLRRMFHGLVLIEKKKVKKITFK
ncbi:MAG: hypothetical protein V3V54_01350, partial [Candidatus Brocadiales bacterium]